MEKTEIQIVNTEKITHKFYCDNCNKFLGESTECNDGYYKEYGKYIARIQISNERLELERNLCDDCRSKLQENIINEMKKLGFIEC